MPREETGLSFRSVLLTLPFLGRGLGVRPPAAELLMLPRHLVGEAVELVRTRGLDPLSGRLRCRNRAATYKGEEWEKGSPRGLSLPPAFADLQHSHRHSRSAILTRPVSGDTLPPSARRVSCAGPGGSTTCPALNFHLIGVKITDRERFRLFMVSLDNREPLDWLRCAGRGVLGFRSMPDTASPGDSSHVSQSLRPLRGAGRS